MPNGSYCKEIHRSVTQKELIIAFIRSVKICHSKTFFPVLFSWYNREKCTRESRFSWYMYFHSFKRPSGEKKKKNIPGLEEIILKPIGGSPPSTAEQSTTNGFECILWDELRRLISRNTKNTFPEN